MPDDDARYARVIRHAQVRNARHLRFAALIVILIVLLLWRTQWLTLRPGLIVLLIGQLGAVFILLYRNATLSRTLYRLQNAPTAASNFLIWFAAEESFVKRLAFFENGLRVIGFLLLAYGFWIPTRSLFIALLIGVAYPITAYFGIGRKNQRKTLQELHAQKDSL